MFFRAFVWNLAAAACERHGDGYERGFCDRVPRGSWRSECILDQMFVVLSLLVLSTSVSDYVTAQESPVNGTACPLNFSVLDRFPYVADTIKQNVDERLQCSTIQAAFEMVLALYLRDSGFFLPPKGTSRPCLETFQRQLRKQGISGTRNFTDICQWESYSVERGTDFCQGVQTGAEFRKLIPNSEFRDLNSSCSVSLASASACAVCNIALLKATAVVQQVANGNTSQGDTCSNFTTVFTAGTVSELGPTDPGTALCLFFIKSPKHKAAIKSAVFIGVGLGAFALLVGVVGCFVYGRRRKIKLKKALENSVPTGLLDSTRVPQSSVEWFTIDEIRKATGNFSRDNLLGSGGYGNVYKGLLKDGSLIAVKRFKNCSPVGDVDFVHEVEMISSVRHKHLVAIRGCCVDSSGSRDVGHQRIIVYDYMANGSLLDHLFPKQRHLFLDWPTRAKIVIGMAKGLAYLHHDALPSIIHRDIKASNILLDKDFSARLADFGLAKFTPEGASHLTTKVAGTYGYVAPEYALYGRLTEKSDVYSFGMVLLEVVTGRRALSSTTDNPPQTLLSEWVWPFVKSGMWKDVVDSKIVSYYDEEVERFLLVGLLCAHPQVNHRPTAAQAMKMLENHLAVPVIPDRPSSIALGRPSMEAGEAQTREATTEVAFLRTAPAALVLKVHTVNVILQVCRRPSTHPRALSPQNLNRSPFSRFDENNSSQDGLCSAREAVM